MTKRDELTRYLDELLESGRFRDYCPNGLQVEGRGEVRRIVAGVTASQALIEAAIARDADMLLVHHGWFWRGEDGRVTGFRKTRMQTLLKHDINLVSYHLPLDGHAELGNNVLLGRRMGWAVEGRFGDQDVGWYGRTSKPTTLAALAGELSVALRREPLVIPGGNDPQRPVSRIAWCANPGWPISLPAIMPPSVSACRRLRRMWRNASASSASLSISRIRSEAPSPRPASFLFVSG
jgi:dinuclear metal center YbgI/SA1388 family protein